MLENHNESLQESLNFSKESYQKLVDDNAQIKDKYQAIKEKYSALKEIKDRGDNKIESLQI